jgi:hypothetical protein
MRISDNFSNTLVNIILSDKIGTQVSREDREDITKEFIETLIKSLTYNVMVNIKAIPREEEVNYDLASFNIDEYTLLYDDEHYLVKVYK